jgi:hypothetical protein
MAQKVGNLVVEMSANVARLQRDFNKATSQAQRVGRRFKSIFKGVGLSIAAGLSVAGLSNLVKSSLNAADAIAKGAAKANIATGTYQELAFALDKFDVSQEQATTGLMAFTKRLGEARSGTGALVTFLKKYDQALLDSLTSAESNEQALNIFMRALGGVKNDADRAALAAAAFSRSAGVSMAAALKDGGAALDQWRKKARELGVVIDADLLKRAEDAKDRFATLGQVVQAKTVVALADLVDILSSKEFLSALEKATTLAVKLAGGMASIFAALPQGLGSGFGSKFQGLSEQIATARKEVKKFGDQIHALEAIGSKGQIGQLQEKLRWAENNLKRLEALAAKANAAREKQEAGGSTPPPPKPTPPPVVDIPDIKEMRSDVVGLADLWKDRVAEITKATRTPFEVFKQGVAELDFLKSNNLIDPEIYRRAFNQLGADYASTVDKIKETTTELSEFTKEAFRSMQNVASDFFFDTLEGNFTDLGDSFRKMVNRMLADWASVKMMRGLFGEDFGKAGELGGIIGGIFGGARALGGPVMAGNAYLVGERGPELFMPQTSGNVVANNKLGGTSISVPIGNIDGGSKQLLANLPGMIENACLEAMRRYS